MAGEDAPAARGAPGGAGRGGTPGAQKGAGPGLPKLRVNSRRTCRRSGPGLGTAACGAPTALRRTVGEAGGRTTAAPGRPGPERGAEAAAASLGVAEESLGFRTGWLFGCRLQEGKSNPHPNFARLDRFDAQMPPPQQPRLPATLLLPRSLARSLGRPGRCAALPLPLPPAPSLCFMQIRVQPPFQALSPPPCRRGSPPSPPLPPPLPATSSPGRPARPQPPGGRPISPARPGARPRGRSRTAAALAGARRTPRGLDLSPAGPWRKSWERSRERGPRRGTHTQEAQLELRAREGNPPGEKEVICKPSSLGSYRAL
ncbi:uncharacterized protein LOC141570760 [Rhinolophus sinicus]|uniref:uncharacterized protein LOC141570760 n=1 Tax=Rhinolophus sinicus TaxID=89399 RepID=UPI003D7B9B93